MEKRYRVFKNPYVKKDASLSECSLRSAKLVNYMTKLGFRIIDWDERFPVACVYVEIDLREQTWSPYSTYYIGPDGTKKEKDHRYPIGKKKLEKWVRENPHYFTAAKFGL